MLTQLIGEICQLSLRSPKRRKLMNRLLGELQHLPQLRKSTHPDYLAALNQTWVWVNTYLCEQFDASLPDVPTRLAQWINAYLFWRIKDLYGQRGKEVSLNEARGEQEWLDLLPETGFKSPSLTGLDRYIEQLEQQQQEDYGIQLRNYITTDPEGKLQSCHPKQYSQANCQVLLQRHLLKQPPDKISTIARDLEINYQTLNSHWKRNCLPLLRTLANDILEHDD
ncbi:hypothetical protein PN462_09640 [Spirulina sp. CS-785/01]|uniref:hypothetical protein n=1 Tax=Spirulina sp. CS-785/01 TaxID=3021716 RepID=UPI00232CBF27|nr:hypothetical protein [Spirulina sp. CS-785/01]MDB9313360.1 hypothetical protein [Spirulina sp. CS-785/01]